MKPTTEKAPAPRLISPAALLRAARFVFETAPGWTLLGGAVTTLLGLLPLASVYVMKLILDAAAGGVSAADKEEAFMELMGFVALAAGLALAGVVARSAGGLVSEIQSRRVQDHMLDVIHRKSTAVDLSYYEDPRYQDTLHRAQAEAPFRPLSIVGGLTGVLRSSAGVLSMAALLFAFNPALGTLVVLAAVPTALVRMRHARRLYHWQRDRTATERRAAWLSRVLTGRLHAKEVRLFDLGPHFEAACRDVRSRLREERLSLARRRALAQVFAQALSVAAIFLSTAFLAFETIQGRITLGDLVMYGQAIQRGQGFVQELFSSLSGLYEDALFLENLYEFLDLEERIRAPAEASPTPPLMQGSLVFEDVSFSYPNTGRPVLRGFNLRIAAGEHVALVGRNGAGKSTVVKLLCRLYDPDEGHITLDGRDIREFDPHSYRRLISAVFQDHARYDLTVRENIRLGDLDCPQDDMPRIQEAARKAGVHELVRRLPRSYDTLLGNFFEDGVQLSVGEWQKIALARAFLREASLVVLDEPASALDPESEARLFEHFRTLVAGRAALLISHRLSAVTLSDRICLLDGGRIVESGPHRELLAERGIYARLFEAQARHYL